MDITKKYSLKELKDIQITIKKPMLVFLHGDLGAGKTTLSKHIFKNILCLPNDVSSPTYTYYNKYGEHYHFDLYRLSDYDEFFAIGGEEVLDNNTGVIIVEWSDVISQYYTPDLEIFIEKTEKDDERKLSFVYKK